MNENEPKNWKEEKNKKQKESLHFPKLSPKYFPSKKTVFILTIIQLMFAISHFIENTILIHRNFYDFYDIESRLVVTIVWSLTLCWILCTIILITGLLTNSPLLFLPHIAFSIFWLFCMIIILIIMIISKASLTPLLLVIAICVIIIVSLPYEWNCYNRMRTLV